MNFSRFPAQTHLSPEVMEVSVCSRFFIDSLLSLRRPEAPDPRAEAAEPRPPGAPVSRPESTLLPAHLRSRPAASSFFIRDILSDGRSRSLLEPGRPERLQTDHQNKSTSSGARGEEPSKIKAQRRFLCFSSLSFKKTEFQFSIDQKGDVFDVVYSFSGLNIDQKSASC